MTEEKKQLITAKRIGLGLIFVGFLMSAVSSGLLGVIEIAIAIGGYYIFLNELMITVAMSPPKKKKGSS